VGADGVRDAVQLAGAVDGGDEVGEGVEGPALRLADVDGRDA
jgi:hypothetical protein